MNEDQSSNDLVAIGRFGSPVEASLAQNWLADEGIEAKLDGAATANWLNYYGANLVGARLWVKQSDVARAREVLGSIPAEREEGEELDKDETLPTPPLIRAYRAAVIGSIVFPPLLSIYSLFLVFKHRLWEPQAGETSVNWRFYVALCFDVVGLLVFWWIVAFFRN